MGLGEHIKQTFFCLDRLIEGMARVGQSTNKKDIKIGLLSRLYSQHNAEVRLF